MKQRIAIIGAGLSGAVIANQLSEIADISMFEKSRGFGGRMSTRTRGDYQFDHGAQYFTAKNESFKAFLAPYIESQHVQSWQPTLASITKGETISTSPYPNDDPLYVATPRMSSFCRHLAHNVDTKLQIKIDAISQLDSQWELKSDGQSLGTFDWVVAAIPSHQVSDLIPAEFEHKATIDNIKMLGCYSLMLGFDTPLSLNFDAAKVNNSSISWIAANHHKPERNSQYSLMIQSSNQWAEEHIEDDQESVKQQLVKEVSTLLGRDVSHAPHIDLHRWRYANAPKHNGEAAYIDSKHKLVACGDWCIEGRVEAAYLSAINVINSLKTQIAH